MSGRGLRATGVVCGALALLLNGCSLGTHPQTTSTTQPASALPPPIGSIEHPRPVECVDGTTYTTGLDGTPTLTPPSRPHLSPFPSSHASGKAASDSASRSASAGAGDGVGEGVADVTVGPLTWRGLRSLASGDQRAHGVEDSGGWHYRAGPDVNGDAVVTVTVGAEQRARAGLEYGGAYGNAPAPSVTFHGCPDSITSFYGGFFVAGDGRACVPLDVRVGNSPPRRVVVSFFNGPCPA